MKSTTSTRLAAALLVIAALALRTAAVGEGPAPSPGGHEEGCASTVMALAPCLDFLRGKDAAPSKACCSGAQKLNDELKTKEQKQEACECIKNALKSYDGIDNSRIPEVPKQCKIQTTLPPIDANFDCSKYAFISNSNLSYIYATTSIFDSFSGEVGKYLNCTPQ